MEWREEAVVCCFKHKVKLPVARCLFVAFFCTLELDASRSKSELLEVDLLAVENQS